MGECHYFAFMSQPKTFCVTIFLGEKSIFRLSTSLLPSSALNPSLIPYISCTHLESLPPNDGRNTIVPHYFLYRIENFIDKQRVRSYLQRICRIGIHIFFLCISICGAPQYSTCTVRQSQSSFGPAITFSARTLSVGL